MFVVEHLRKLEEKRNGRITDPLFKGIPIPIPINVGKIEGEAGQVLFPIH